MLAGILGACRELHGLTVGNVVYFYLAGRSAAGLPSALMQPLLLYDLDLEAL